jgi:hypothetical protein
MTRNGRTSLPGTRLLEVARALFSEETIRVLFEPAIADLQHEWRQTAPGSWQRRFTLLRAYRAYLRLLLIAPFAGRTVVSSTAPHGRLLAVVDRRNDDALGKVLLMWALLLASMWSLFGTFVIVLAAGALATAAVLHHWHCRYAGRNGLGAGPLPGRPEINFAAIPVYGNMAGLLVVVGSLAVIAAGLPVLGLFLLLAALTGAAVATALRAWHLAHPASCPNSIVAR